MTSKRSSLFFLTILTIISPIFGYKILMFCPIPARSHYNLCRGIVDSLVDRGHEVTFVSAYKTENTKFKDLSLPEMMELKGNQLKPSFEIENKSVFERIEILTNMQKAIAEKSFSHDSIKTLFSDKSQKFDAVIFEYFMNEMSIGLGVKYECPVIVLSPAGLLQWLAVFTNNPLYVASVPNMFTSFTGTMNLWQRMVNLFATVTQEILGMIFMQPLQRSLYEQYFPEESKKVSYDGLMKQISGVLVNGHPSIGFARPLLPNTVEIGGYHIKDPEPLPEDLKKMLDNDVNGIVYFSMGSNLQSKDMSPELKSLLLKAFSKLKHTVLWKYEEDFPNLPENVIIRKWMPQTGILAHPNVKLFISHGGLLSCTEAAHFGVPLLAIPIFGDQRQNALALQERGNGRMLQFQNITEETFEWTLKETLENPKYGEVAKDVQRLYHDRPMRPRDLLTFTVEHIIRSKGAKHLAPAPLCKWSHMMLDVFGIIIMAVSTVTILLMYIVWKCCCRRRKLEEKLVKKSDKKQKKQ